MTQPLQLINVCEIVMQTYGLIQILKEKNEVIYIYILDKNKVSFYYIKFVIYLYIKCFRKHNHTTIHLHENLKKRGFVAYKNQRNK